MNIVRSIAATLICFSIAVQADAIAAKDGKTKPISIKKENELGSIAVGKLADLVLLDDSITAKAVYVGGVKVSL